MGPKPFKPSINWSAAPMDSLRWLAIAWVISAVCVVVVLVLLRSSRRGAGSSGGSPAATSSAGTACRSG